MQTYRLDKDEWQGYFESLRATATLIAGWAPEEPNRTAIRCEQSRHRTLAHLRACQEQWLQVVLEFQVRENPRITILHPWRRFDLEGYQYIGWDEHMSNFVEDRLRWMELQSADPLRGGFMNRKPETTGSLLRRLATHEAYHVSLLCHRLWASDNRETDRPPHN